MSSSSTLSTTLDRSTVALVDKADQLTDILAIPEHLRDALWKVASANLSDFDTAGGLVVAGMGGSAVGGLLARAVLGDRASRPILTSSTYGLPAWTTPDTTVLCASYSGNTEETLACYEAAGALGATRVVATSGGKLAELARTDQVPVIPIAGGLQPRAAVAYMTVAVLEVAAICGAAPRMNSEIDVTAEHLENLVAEWGPDSDESSLAKQLATQISGTIPVIIGAGVTAPIAYRWKTQTNENAKTPAFNHELPEMDHNELVGWTRSADMAKFSAIFLDDCDSHPRVKRRIELTRQLIQSNAAQTITVESRGTSALERVMSLVMLGDLVSLYLAVLYEVDPSPVEIIETLKQKLAQPISESH